MNVSFAVHAPEAAAGVGPCGKGNVPPLAQASRPQTMRESCPAPRPPERHHAAPPVHLPFLPPLMRAERSRAHHALKPPHPRTISAGCPAHCLRTPRPLRICRPSRLPSTRRHEPCFIFGGPQPQRRVCGDDATPPSGMQNDALFDYRFCGGRSTESASLIKRLVSQAPALDPRLWPQLRCWTVSRHGRIRCHGLWQDWESQPPWRQRTR